MGTLIWAFAGLWIVPPNINPPNKLSEHAHSYMFARTIIPQLYYTAYGSFAFPVSCVVLVINPC